MACGFLNAARKKEQLDQTARSEQMRSGNSAAATGFTQCGVVIIVPAWALVSVTVSELEAIMIAGTMAIVAVL